MPILPLLSPSPSPSMEKGLDGGEPCSHQQYSRKADGMLHFKRGPGLAGIDPHRDQRSKENLNSSTHCSLKMSSSEVRSGLFFVERYERGGVDGGERNMKKLLTVCAGSR